MAVARCLQPVYRLGDESRGQGAAVLRRTPRPATCHGNCRCNGLISSTAINSGARSGSAPVAASKAAADTETTQRLEPAASRFLRALACLIVIVLLSTTRLPLWPSGIWPLDWSCCYCRRPSRHLGALGRNWSRSVTIKRGHELVTTGRYAAVRHPIYTGILTGLLTPRSRSPRCAGSSFSC